MATENVQGPIPHDGEGFVARQNGNYQPGEYKRLANIEIRNGILTNRRNVRGCGTTALVATNHQKFLGTLDGHALFTGITNLGVPKQWAAGPNGTYELWSDFTSIQNPAPTGTVDYFRFHGFFQYNREDFWIVTEHGTSGVDVCLYWAPNNGQSINEYHSGYAGGLNRTVVVNVAGNDPEYQRFRFRNFFVYKERLWLVTTAGLYFSKATDPKNFDAASGWAGYFRYPNDEVTWGMAIKDNIYTVCSSAIYALSYSTDPNMDSIQRPISDTIGGEMGCIHLDTPYVVNNLGIFAITGTNIEKVLDNRWDYGEDYYRNHIYSFENYLVVNRYERSDFGLSTYNQGSGPYYRINAYPSPYSDVTGNAVTTGFTTSMYWPSGSVPSGMSGITPSINNANTYRYKGTGNRLGMTVSTSGLTGKLTENRVTVQVQRSFTATYDTHGGGKEFKFAFDFHVPDISIPISNIKMDISFRNASNTQLGLHTQTFSAPNPGNTVRLISSSFSPPTTVNNVLITFRVDEAQSSLGGQFYTGEMFFAFDRFQWEQVRTFGEFFAGDFHDSDRVDYSWSGAGFNSPSYVTFSPGAVSISEGPVFTPGKRGNSLGYNTYFVDTETGSVHVLDFTDRSPVGGPLEKGYISDMYVSPYKDNSGNYYMYFVTGYINPDGTASYVPYYLSSSEDIEVLDKVYFTGSSTYQAVHPKIDIEIDSAVPDGNEYMVKKFRTLEMEGIYPSSSGTFLYVTYDNAQYPANGIECRDTVAMSNESRRPHYPHRVGLNQRGRSITLRWNNKDAWYGPSDLDPMGPFEVSDIRTRYTYTARAKETRNNS